MKTRRVPFAISDWCERLRLDGVSCASDLLSAWIVPNFVDVSQETKRVLVVSKPDVEAVLDIPAVIVSSAGAFSAKSPANLIEPHVMLRAKLSGSRQFERRTEARNASADD